MLLKDFIPPILVKFARRLRPKRAELYPSYAFATSACGKGYEDPALVEVILSKTKTYRDQVFAEPPFLRDLPAVVSLCGIGFAALDKSTEINVIDFGGAC